MLEYKLVYKINEDIKKIREEVFIVEQGFKEEFDDIDNIATFILVFFNNKAIATSRVYKSEVDEYYIGRVAVLKEYRDLKVGKKMLELLEEEVKKLGGKRLIVSSQVRAQGFYEKCGFVSFGNTYLDEHVPHILMKKEV